MSHRSNLFQLISYREKQTLSGNKQSRTAPKNGATKSNSWAFSPWQVLAELSRQVWDLLTLWLRIYNLQVCQLQSNSSPTGHHKVIWAPLLPWAKLMLVSCSDPGEFRLPEDGNSTSSQASLSLPHPIVYSACFCYSFSSFHCAPWCSIHLNYHCSQTWGLMLKTASKSLLLHPFLQTE